MQGITVKRPKITFVKNFTVNNRSFALHKSICGSYAVITSTYDYSKIFAIVAKEFITNTSNKATFTCLPIKRKLSEDTRKQGVLINNTVFSLHITTNKEVIITDNSDYTKILHIQSLDFYKFTETCN